MSSPPQPTVSDGSNTADNRLIARSSGYRIWILPVGVLVIAAVWRFLAMKGFPNDHFVHLTAAQQMLFGEWPTRDFLDPGMPLMYVTSAFGQLILGRTQFSEAVLVAVAIGFAAGFTAAAVRDLTGSVAVALVAALIEVLIFPRAYGYPKMLLYAAACFVFVSYARCPTRAGRVAMASLVAVAFLFRHDHGVYIGLAAVTAVMLNPQVAVRSRVREACTMVAIVLALVGPYFLFVQLSQGLGVYVRTGLAFSRAEGAREPRIWPNPFSIDPFVQDPAAAHTLLSWEFALAILLYLFYAMPALCIAALWFRRREQGWSSRVAALGPVVVLAAVVNYGFLRDPLNTRIPDAVVPAVVLGGFLLRSGSRSDGYLRWSLNIFRATALAVALACVVSVGDVYDVYSTVTRDTLWTHPIARLADQATALRTPFGPYTLSRRADTVMVPFFQYVGRCTTESDSIFVGGFLPEVPYLARRPFAGGQSTFIPGYYALEENQQFVVSKLRSQKAPLALIPSEYLDDFARGFPRVEEYFAARYEELANIVVDESSSVHVFIDRTRRPVSRDPETGWPCYR